MEAVIGAFIDTFIGVCGTGSLLEEIQHYNAIYALMNGMVSDNHRQSSMAVMSGCSGTPLSFESCGANATNAIMNDQTKIDKQESYVGTHIPMSGFFNCDRLVPLGFTNGTCYIEITLPAVNTPLLANSNATLTAFDWEVSEDELHIPVLRMGSEFTAACRQLLA